MTKLFYKMYEIVNDGLFKNNYNLGFNVKTGIGESTNAFDIDINGEPNFVEREINFATLLEELKNKNIKPL